MPDDNTRDDAERLEDERQARLRIGSDAQRRIRDADADLRVRGTPDDIISVRDAALRNACAELDARDAALRDVLAEAVRFKSAFLGLCAVLDIPSHPLDWDGIREQAERKLAALRDARAEEREACAQIADLYAENPPSGDDNNTQAAFNVGMDHMAGCMDAATCISEAIRDRAASPPCPARRTKDDRCARRQRGAGAREG